MANPSFPWLSDEPPAVLTDGEVHIWQAKLDMPDDELSRLADLLSSDERDRAARFRVERGRRHFVSGRGILRSILGRYLKRAPEELAFAYGVRGKPFLPGMGLQFNLAHSDGVAVIAVAASGAVGIDIERVRPLQDFDGIIKSFFSTAEAEAILAESPANRLRAFFTCWTRKEAYLKATGDGITVPLDRFTVSVIPGSLPRLLHVEGAPCEETRWSFQDVPLGADYICVVAFEGAIRKAGHYMWHRRMT